MRNGWRHARYVLGGEIFYAEGADLSSTVFALLGFLSPSNRGSLATVMIVCWTFFGG